MSLKYTQHLRIQSDDVVPGTMSEIEKALVELKSLMKYRSEQLGYEEEFRGLGLTSRKNLCLHPSVKREKSGSVVDARCRSLTAGFVKEKKDRGESVDLCVYHDVITPSPIPLL
jgi:DNA excision repair protein ERCC-2